MSGGSHQDRILDLLRSGVALDDDEIASKLGIEPRQTVNQVCRRLAGRGLITRTWGPTGKIVNGLADGAGDRSPPSQPKALPRPSIAVTAGEDLVPASLARTLIILPCSGSKKPGGDVDAAGPSILASLPPTLAGELAAARKDVARRIVIGERQLMPAWQRYDGAVYSASGHAIEKMMDAGAHVLILSGGYGLVSAAEPIGDYNAVLKPGWWPHNLLGRCLLAYAASHRVQSVRAFAAATSPYYRVLSKLDWSGAGVSDALLLAPRPEPGGMAKSPRTIGEALAALADGRLDSNWISSYGLPLDITRRL